MQQQITKYIASGRIVFYFISAYFQTIKKMPRFCLRYYLMFYFFESIIGNCRLTEIGRDVTQNMPSL